MNDWRIHRREARCTRCERSFEEGEAIFSLLSVEADALRREDRCPNCFEEPRPAEAPSEAPTDGPVAEAAHPSAHPTEAPPAGVDVLFWRTRHLADRRARFAVDFEAIEELFLALEGRREGTLSELRYLLSLLLMRKKRLKLVGVRRTANSEVLCVRRPRRQEEFEVQVFELDSERVLALQAELARVFEGAGVEALETPDRPDRGAEASAPECSRVAETGIPEPTG